MTFSGKIIRGGNWTQPLTHYNGEALLVAPGLAAREYVGTATIGSTGATSWDIADRKGENPILPIGSRIYRVALFVPTGIVATDTNLLKLAATLAEAASPNNLLSSAAASSTFASETALKDTIFPGNTTALAAPTTLRLFSAATGGTTAGSAMSSAVVGGAKVRVQICYTIPAAPIVSNPDFRFDDAKTKTGRNISANIL